MTEPKEPKDAGDVVAGGGVLEFEGEPMSGERKKPSGKPPNGKKNGATQAAKNAEHEPGGQLYQLWHRQLTFSKNGDCKPTVGNIELILRSDPTWSGCIGYNARSNKIMFVTRPPFENDAGPLPREVGDTATARVSVWLERTKPYVMPINPRSDTLNGAIDVVAEANLYDPVKLYLEGLQWDGTPRIDDLLIHYCGAAETLINQVYAAKWMISAVARTFEPGCKVDTMLVLVGKQGIKKSWFGSALAGAPYFGDHLPPLSDTADAAAYLLGLWIVEMAELDALGRGELATAKAFLSRATDRYRKAYGRRVEDHDRRCVFLGTTNEDEFLRDTTGGRRFWPVEVVSVDIDGIIANRDQLWAEAVHRYRAGESWYLSEREDIAEASETQERRFQVDAWEPRIVEWLDEPPNHLEQRFTTGHIMATALKLEIGRWTRADQMRVGGVLQRLGWKRRQARGEDGRRDYFYYRPGEEPPKSGQRPTRAGGLGS